MLAPPSITAFRLRSIESGEAVRRSTPNGLLVMVRTRAISDSSNSVVMVAAPKVPMPPASETAATRSPYDTPPMPASMTGSSMLSISVRRVFMPSTVLLALVRIGTGTGKKLSVPPSWRKNNGPWLIFKHPARKMAPCPRIGINQSKCQSRHTGLG